MSPTVPVAPMESRLTTSQRVQPDVSTRKLSSVSPPSLTSPNFEQSSNETYQVPMFYLVVCLVHIRRKVATSFPPNNSWFSMIHAHPQPV